MESDATGKFGEFIKAARQARGMTTRAASQRASISEVHWSRVESGRSIRRDTALAMAQAVGADPDEALLAAGYAPSSPWPDREAEDRDFDLSTDPVIQALATGMDPDAIEAAKKAVIDGARVTLAEFVRARQAGKKAE